MTSWRTGWAVVIGLLLVLRPAMAFEPKQTFEAEWTADLSWDSGGYGVMLATPATSPDVRPRNWVEPNLPGVLAIGFDNVDPPTTNPFNADGNIYNRPQQQVSIQLNGREIYNRRAGTSLGAATTQPTTRPAPVKTTLSLRFVTGGAEITVRVGEKAVYDHVLIPGLTAAEFDPKFGGGATIRDIATRWTGPTITPAEPPQQTMAFYQTLIDTDHRTTTQEVAFPDDVTDIGRVICTFKLLRTPAGLDKWDRIGTVHLIDAKGERFEVLRFMTPYSREWTWQQDVTDLLPLLRGKQKMEISCETYGPGWLATVRFDYYRGPIEHRPVRVRNVWERVVILGQKELPIDGQLPPVPLTLSPDTKAAKLRAIVTGHGWSGNARDAGEFCPLWRKLHVGGETFFNNLWTTDNDLTPCRPQGGTWKFDRAGWGPGKLVEPWTVELNLNKFAAPATQPAMIRYEIEPYDNPKPKKEFPAQHWLTVQLIECE